MPEQPNIPFPGITGLPYIDPVKHAQNHWIPQPNVTAEYMLPRPVIQYVVALDNETTVTLVDKESAEKLAKFLLTVKQK